MAERAGGIRDRDDSPGVARTSASTEDPHSGIQFRKFLGSRSMRRATRVALVLPLTLWRFIQVGDPVAVVNAALINVENAMLVGN